MTLECESEAGNHAGGGNDAAAGRFVGALPTLCRAEPGILQGADLSLIAGRGMIV